MLGTILDITERKRAEEALREEHQRMAGIIKGTNVGTWEWNVQTGETIFNDRWAEIIGYTLDEISPVSIETWMKFAHEDDLKASGELLEKHFHGELEYYEFESRMKHKDGNLVWVLDRGKVTSWAKDGKPLVMMGTHQDITAQKRAEEALRESEERFRRLANATWEGIIIHREGAIMDANESASRILGYPVEEIIGKNILTFIAPESIEPTIRKLREGTTHDQLYLELNALRKDKTIFPAEALGRPIRYNNIDARVLAFRDISDRKRAEDVLRASEEKYRVLFEGINEAVFVHDLEEDGLPGRFLQVNDVACRRLGYTREELMSLTPRDITIPEEYERLADKRIGLASQGDILAETIHLTKDGKKIPVESNIRQFQYLGRQVALSISRDISDRKRAEEERTILEERLRQADKMEAIGTLAGGIAHDFNNLLMGIQGHASLALLDLDPSHPHYERLKSIEEQVESGAALTKQLLGFARGGRYEVKPADLNDILKKSSSMFGRTKKEITINRKYGKDLWPVEVDRGQMEQVFMNLYVNAWQAMPGGGEIYLETENVLLDDEQAFPYAVKPGKYVKITVTDTGTGMDEKTKERIFDPFFTTKGMGRGTGLGLATVYGIIKGHKGMIRVDSEPGHGTTFTIHLPASEKEVVKEKTATGTIARGTETILLVDDEKMVLEVSREILEFLGYRVYAAGSGQEAIAVYMEKKTKIDMVLLDMNMPGISGGETFDRLREINSGIKVLLSSGYSIEGEAQEILGRGCNGFIQKPFHLEKLSQKVREMLD